eukprot:CAMPEP_0198290210 /NCGR_PEP_ID=MMETSP1449-20131203/8148_1 /TAXON_ID=420275 /ORGANISM="Attheya septentrionalis, Strain CCMP2084" /LENGTH=617 /DNA_ID=CAMNT_0043988685 /DNA_START=33 /DNA_END=1886 /DNA_ORIENTATION=-
MTGSSATFAAVLMATLGASQGVVRISEVASQGIFDVCGGKATVPGDQYVELHNSGVSEQSLEGYVLYDDKGPTGTEAYTFTGGEVIAAKSFLVVCRGTEFQFGIGDTDTIGLQDAVGTQISTSGVLPGFGDLTHTYQHNSGAGKFLYAAPTPGAQNKFQADEVVINEVASESVNNVCKGKDFVELANIGSNVADISNWLIHDDRGHGKNGTEEYIFAADTKMAPQSFMLLCNNKETFRFGIAGRDTITLVDANKQVVSTPGPLQGSGQSTNTSTYQRRSDGTYAYSFPSPEFANTFSSEIEKPVVINELSTTGTYKTCGGSQDAGGNQYIELLNTGDEEVDLTGYRMFDDKGPLSSTVHTFDNVTMAAGEYLLICGSGKKGNFQFGIGGRDTITLTEPNDDIVSTTGVLQNQFTTDLSYQRRNDGTYTFAIPSPGNENVIISDYADDIFINEISDTGTYNVCGGDDKTPGADFIEFGNKAKTAIDVGGFIIIDDDTDFSHKNAGVIPSGTIIKPESYLIFCADKDFNFGIAGRDQVSILDNHGTLLSSSKLEGQGTPDMSFSRTGDGEFVYATPTPGGKNMPDEKSGKPGSSAASTLSVHSALSALFVAISISKFLF